MDDVSIKVHVINHYLDTETTAPTLPIAIAHSVPGFSTGVGSSRTVLGVRPYGASGRSFHGYGLVVEIDDHGEGEPFGRYNTRHVDIPEHLEAFDVWEELNDIEGGLRYFAQDKIDDPNFHQGIIDRGVEYVEAVNQVLIYDPKAKIDLDESLEEIFDGADWAPWMRSLPVHAPHVDIQNVEIVEREQETLLLRFEYYFADPSGLSVHNTELEFVDLVRGRWKVRTGRYSALRGLCPAFNGWQLPQVHSDLQRALDDGRVVEKLLAPTST
ncbi:hypothetical protein ELI36_32560 [Rhizobium ruizarguesonis]|uniref:hypothetical protein n=1 Tax=Rhizobium ruizarguesonis TaxID=2081791 RepID=UPI0010318BE7|nr:hypothetical protein [Rhizobium ruizarguesonis]TAV21278.1 hypothetical protein ELI36_32560 [Rhizobium ruizarguesonis]